jgi:hypothetical protein
MPDFRQESLCRTEFFSATARKTNVSRSFSGVRGFPRALEILFPVCVRWETGWKFFVRCPAEKNRAGNSLCGVRRKKITLENLRAVSGGNKSGWKISLGCPAEFPGTGNSFFKARFRPLGPVFP